jgi:lipoate-protein ligase A
MALDEVLLDAVAAGRRGPVLRFWGWTEPALVLGSNQSVGNELDLQAVRRRGFIVTRRLSGGGTMLAEPGRTITWSLCLPQDLVAAKSFRESYEFLDSFAVAALRELGVDAGYRPINDIVSPAGKIAGAAQARRRGAVLHHTTMAYAMDPALLVELIRIGRPGLTERGVRSAEKAVSPVATLLPGVTREEVLAALATAFASRWPVLGTGRLEDADLDAAASLAAAKYSRQEWIERLP